MSNQQKIQQQTSRNYGIDLLRILCMVMVCGVHVFGSCPGWEQGSVTYWSAETLRIICLCAVNCYAMISGYVGFLSRHRLRSLFSLWLTVVFYSVLFTFVFDLINPSSVSLEDWAKSFLPVLSIRYWYFSAYALLFFFMPLANVFVRNATEFQLRMMLIGVLLLSVGSTVFNAVNDLWSAGDGFSVFWLFVMYLCGAYLRRNKKLAQLPWVRIFALFVLLTVLSKAALFYVGSKVGKSWNIDILTMYQSPTIVLSAVSLVMFFSRIKLSGRLISVISYIVPLTFSVYIIHYNKQLWPNLQHGITLFSNLPEIVTLLCAVLSIVLMFIVCIGVDVLRANLFRVLKIDQLCVWAEGCLGCFLKAKED